MAGAEGWLRSDFGVVVCHWFEYATHQLWRTADCGSAYSTTSNSAHLAADGDADSGADINLDFNTSVNLYFNPIP